ncbi:BamA/TamA family outer membrane protein [Pricia sp. S334]|uniref:BamA/TamA family outer membrane protein n=1 Tax=Pricia mediterranea TaxID=3076079 RepID=A0ABU3LA17_9FLAO|nr:BamA/TamA family outer membrane protein [Pricia sp. S334]MDT7830233.1 BamA/TamA family outer membrane protein [Pricia sp. S334]
MRPKPNGVIGFLCLIWFVHGLTAQQTEISSLERTKVPNSERFREISHRFYLISNIGNVPISEAEAMIGEINQRSGQDTEATLLVIGNVLTEEGFPSKNSEQEKAKVRLEKLMAAWDGFNGGVILTPGKNEWVRDAPKSIDELESFLQDNSKAKFWPNDGCSLERETINDEVVLEMVDSQWFLEDWDDHAYMNRKCEHKTREEFLAEFKDDIKDSQGKTVVVAVYQPVMTNTKSSLIDKLGGFSPNTFENSQNSWLRGRLETIASQFQDVIFVSGKDRNLQYLEDDGIPQIISGALGNTEKTGAVDDGHFASEKNGYAQLTIFKDGSSEVEFVSIENGASKRLFTKQIKRERPVLADMSFPEKTDATTQMASIYTPEETDKSGLFKWMWGDHYRSLYSKKVEAPILHLDELPNGVRPISEGGGTQSRSLRLIDDNEHEYTLRALRKSAVRFIQATAIRDHYVEDYLENTLAERILLDFYTTSHPYAQFAMPKLSKSLNILHANPSVYYVPRQEGLGIYSDAYGDALFMLEEHAGDENKAFETFGRPDDILSTADLRLALRETKDAFVDQAAYIRARLLDQLTGNWDRHQDQWRWAEFETEEGKKRYEVIPRDWDQTFPKYDGPIISLLKFSFPVLRKMQSFDADIKNVKWFNLSGYPLDKMFITTAEWPVWKSQIDYIQENLTDRAIDSAFAALPEKAQDSSIVRIKENLRARRDNLENIARRYYDYLTDFQVVKGTEDDDAFLIERKPNGRTAISIMKEGDTVFKNTYDAEKTDEIWVYGLDGNDTFKIVGKGKKKIKLNVMGGAKSDTYDFENPRKVKLYDYKSKDITITNPKSKKWLTDSYDVNTYDYRKRKYTENVLLPRVGYDGDTGFRIGLQDRFRTYGLANNPFSTQHTVGAEYYFATTGFALAYTPEFAHVFKNWNLGFDLGYASPNFTMNYFGRGNGSSYDSENRDRDYNRVRIRQWSASPYLVHTRNGSSFTLRTKLEAKKVSDDNERYIGQVFSSVNDVYDQQRYLTAAAGYAYENIDNPAFPARGMKFDMELGYTANLEGNTNRFGYVKPSLTLMYPLHPSKIAVLATKIAGHAIIGNTYEFYHAALLGGNHSLRAYRNERFNGQTAFYQSTDLRVGISRFRTNFIPIQIGVSAGFDYGRVWSDNDQSEKWHNDFGGSIWVTGFSALTGNLGFYHGNEGNRFQASLGFNF